MFSFTLENSYSDQMERSAKNIIKKSYFIILTLFIGTMAATPAWGQMAVQDLHYTDSIETLIHNASSDTAKSKLLNELSGFWSPKDSGKAAAYARRSLQLSKGHLYEEAIAYSCLASAYFYTDSSKSRKAYFKALSLLQGDTSRRSLSLKSQMWRGYGAMLQSKGADNKTFIDILLNHAIPLAHAGRDTLHEVMYYSDVGMVFWNIKAYNKSIYYYKKAIGLAKKMKKLPDNLAEMQIWLTQNYLNNKYYDSAKYSLDSAWEFLKKQDVSKPYVRYYMARGLYDILTGQRDQGLAHLDKALALARKLELNYLAITIIFQKYKAYKEAKQYSKAREMLLQVYRDSVAFSIPENRLTILYDLAQVEAQSGNMKTAYKWLSQYADLDDSLNLQKTNAQIAALEVKYKTEKKERQILSLKNENKKQLLSLQKKRFTIGLLIAGVLVLLLICILIYLLYRGKRKAALQKEEIHQKRIKEIEQANKLKVYDAMLEGQEQERRRMARDLHDGLGGMLSGVKLKLSDIADNEKGKKDMELYKVINQLDSSVQELRRIARNMMPEALLRFGIETALADLCDSLQTQHIHIDFQSIQLDKNIQQTVQVSIYRIVQELVTNAIRHGHAHNILVQCSQNNNRIFITVEDDGLGFDIKLLKEGKGIGFTNIENRVNLLNGNLDIQSGHGEGTTVNVEIDAHE